MNEKSPKFDSTLKTASNILLIVLFILSILYFLWVRFRIPLIFYINNYREIVQIGGYVLLAGYICIAAILGFAVRFQRSIFRLLSIGLFVFTTMLCCLSTNIALNLPSVLDTASLNDDETFYLTGEIEVFDVHTYHRLYKCDNENIHCETTPFREGGGASFRPLHLMIDKTHNGNEINVMYTYSDGSSILVYTYGTPNRYYDDESAQLGNHLYYLAYYQNPKPNTRTYMLFQCNLDNRACVHLPFEYKGFGRYTDVEVDESTNEINVIFKDDFDTVTRKYGEETLIFTYGEHPRCYVEGCEILEENK